ncbi:hypothetical protein [Agromyces sp. SYSU T00266]|uniref:hypothetical protein n=1 Tax=Agromyces zhanjiangensis TaxID=3158562 RepID=UPI00339098B5
MARELRAKIARVLSDRSVAINAGEHDGVEDGNAVIVWRVVEVRDPDTDELLGNVRLENLRLEVNEVHEHFSLARVRYTGFDPLQSMFAPSKLIVSSERALDLEKVQLNAGDEVTVLIQPSLLGAMSEADDMDSETEADSDSE